MLEEEQVFVKYLHRLDEPREEAKNFGVWVAADKELLIILTLEENAIVTRYEVRAVLSFDDTNERQPF